MSKTIRLQFPDCSFEISLLSGNVINQILAYLRAHTTKRGRIAVSWNGTSRLDYNLIRDNDMINAFIVADNAALHEHIIAQRYNPNYFTICGNMAIPSHFPTIDV